MQNLLRELQETLISDIPITQHLGIHVVSYENKILVLHAPLEANINHKQTAFAGSLNALVTLAGWSQLWLILREQKLSGEIVIQDSSSNYLRPVTKDFTACCHKPEVQQITKMTHMLRAKGIARIELEATIQEDLHTAVTFKGRYVIHTSRNIPSVSTTQSYEEV